MEDEIFNCSIKLLTEKALKSEQKAFEKPQAKFGSVYEWVCVCCR